MTALWRSVAGDSLQVSLIWRGVGFAMVLMSLRVRGSEPLDLWMPGLPPAYHAMLATGVLLALLGPRLILLVASAAAWALILYGYVARHQLDFIADEYLLFAALPLLGAASALVSAAEHRAAGQRWMLRMATLVTLGFAAFHKSNSDFLDPATSCATTLAARLAERWSLPAPPLGPLGALVAEALAPVLLVLYPRVGACWLLVLAAGLGHVGPYAFNSLLAALALAFLPPSSSECWRARPRRTLLLWLAGAAAAGTASANLHADTPDFLWWPYALFEAVLVGAAVLVLLAGGTGEPWWRPNLPPRPWLPGGPAHRALCIVATAALLLQGVAPYLGLRYRLAFAMLSNLRVDDARWNSLVVPAWVHLRDDRHVHVLAILDDHGKPAKLGNRAAIVRPGVYSPQEFRRRLAESQLRRTPGTLHLRYRGQTQVIANFARDPGLRAYAEDLPDERLLQDSLSLGPQRCVH